MEHQSSPNSSHSSYSFSPNNSAGALKNNSTIEDDSGIRSAGRGSGSRSRNKRKAERKSMRQAYLENEVRIAQLEKKLHSLSQELLGKQS